MFFSLSYCLQPKYFHNQRTHWNFIKLSACIFVVLKNMSEIAKTLQYHVLPPRNLTKLGQNGQTLQSYSNLYYEMICWDGIHPWVSIDMQKKKRCAVILDFTARIILHYSIAPRTINPVRLVSHFCWVTYNVRYVYG